MVKFYVGVWQKRQLLIAKRFMLSYRTLRKLANLPELNKQEWILDSGAFSEISIHGHYTFDINEYLETVERTQPDIFVTMDWMCEPGIVRKTGLSIKEHISRTIESHLRIKEEISDFNIKSELMGTIQGWKPEDYIECIDLLKDNGLIETHMGIGSICRRNADNEIIKVISTISEQLPNTKLHGFGIKISALKHFIVNQSLYSCDSMAWSYRGRNIKKKPCDNCRYSCKNCANCPIFMNLWVEEIEKQITFWKHQQSLSIE